MKTRLAWLLYVTGVTRFAAWWNRKHVVILNYHGIADDEPSHLDLSVSLKTFQAQIGYLGRRHNLISLSDFLTANLAGKQLPNYSVVLTFDDGYRNFLRVAPFLFENKIPATLFLVTDMMRQTGETSGSIHNHADKLSWEEVQELDRLGIFDFGSHTCSHASLPNLSPEEVDRELRQSLIELRGRVTNATAALAYPNGAHSGLASERVASAGYMCALTIDPGPNKIGVNPYRLRRQTIKGADDKRMFAARLSCLTSWLYSLRGTAIAIQERLKPSVAASDRNSRGIAERE